MMTIKQILELNNFNNALEIQAQRHPLRQLFWECTLRCNMNCRHCGSDCRISSLQKDMPFQDFEKVLLEIKEHYDSHKIMVVISGGEPLMRPDLLQCGRRIYDLEFPWGIVSNGRLMSERMIDGLLGAGMHSATISLDGLQDDHNWMRGTADAFQHASKAIERLAAEPGIGFDVVTCANRRNLAQLPELKEYLISIGLKNWRIFTVFPVGRAAQDPDMQLNAEQYRQLMDFIVRTRKEGRIHLSYACEGFLGPYEGKVRDRYFTCQAGLSVAGIRADGGISACTSIRSDYDQGNIYRDSFVDVWENRYRQMRDRSWAKTDDCARCKYWKWCKGNGLHLRDENGKLILCNLEKLKK